MVTARSAERRQVTPRSQRVAPEPEPEVEPVAVPEKPSLQEQRMRAKAEALDDVAEDALRLAEYRKLAAKENMNASLTSELAEAIRDHARPLRMTYSEIVELGVRRLFHDLKVHVPGPTQD